jgi:hypothetical protein
MTPGPRFLPAAIGHPTPCRLPAPATSSSPCAWAPLPAPARWCGPPASSPASRSATPGWTCPPPTSPTSCGTCPTTGTTQPWPGRPTCAARCPARPACMSPSPAWSAASPAGPLRCCGTCRAVPPVTALATGGRPSIRGRSGPATASCGCSPCVSRSRAGCSWAARPAFSVGCWRPRTATRCWCSVRPAATRPPPWSSPRCSSGRGRCWPPRSSRTCCAPPSRTGRGAARCW